MARALGAVLVGGGPWRLAPRRRPVALWRLVALWALVGVLAGAVSLFSAGNAPGSAAVSHGRVASEYGRLPIPFEPNRGQASASVRYLARGSGYALGLTESGPILSLDRSAPGVAKAGVSATASLATRFVGASPDPRLVATGALPGKVNYLIGRDPRHWHVGIPTFSRVQYENVWPGIDTSFQGRQGVLEYYYRVAPGADPTRIVMRFSGARQIRLDRTGDLVLNVHGGTVRELAPQAYQLRSGVRYIVPSHFVLSRNGQVGIAVGSYDHAQALVIDPSLSYSTYLGGSGTDVGNGIAVDSSGDAYVTGSTTGSFPTMNAEQSTFGGGATDAFVTKLNPSGSALLYSTYLGGSGIDSGAGIAVDSFGNAYVTGYTTGSFPTLNAAQPTFGGALDAFVTKLSSSGGLLDSTYLGGSGSDYGTGIALDSSGDAFVTGATNGSFPTTGGAYQSAYGGGIADAFVAELTPSLGAVVYATYLGGSGNDAGLGIAVDSSGDAYVTGSTTGSFPTVNAEQGTFGGGSTNAFVAELNSSGSGLVYSTYLGGSGSDSGNAIAVLNNEAYVTGSTTSSNFPTTTGAYQASKPSGAQSAFITDFRPSGAALVYSTYLGGNGTDSGNGIAVDSSGLMYVTGSTTSTNFPTSSGADQPHLASGATQNAFVTQLDPRAAPSPPTPLRYSSYLGGNGTDSGDAIAIQPSGATYVTGSTTSTNFPTTSGAYQRTYGTNTDAFVSKFGLTAGSTSGGGGGSGGGSGGGGSGGSGYTTTTSLFSSDNPSAPGETVTFTAGVSPDPASGTVAFTAFGHVLPGCGAVPVTLADNASCTVTLTVATTYPVQAFFSGSSFNGASYSSSRSPILNQIVTSSTSIKGTKTRLSSTKKKPRIGQLVTLTATVSPGPDGGSVKFLNNGNGIHGCAKVHISGGQATCQTRFRRRGRHGIQAVYSGDSHLAGSQSSSLTEHVRPKSKPKAHH